MSERKSWSEFRPSKGQWFWSVIGASALTMVVGFTWGGWTTAGSARTAQALAVRDARAELAGEICVHNFINADGAKANLAGLRDQSSWARENFIEEGGWATIAGVETTVVNAADVCVERLMKIENLPSAQADGVTES